MDSMIYITAMIIAAMFSTSLTIVKLVAIRRKGPPVASNHYKGEIQGLKKTIDEKQDKSLCDERHRNVKEDLSAGQKRFKIIADTQSSMADSISRIEERVNFLANQSGYGK